MLATLAWGTFAFGAVYEWAFRPLGAAAIVLGAASLLLYRRRAALALPFGLACAALACAAALQLAPLPDSVLTRVSPGTVSFLSRYDLTYSAERTPDPRGEIQAAPRPRPISIDPVATQHTLFLLVAFAVLAGGTATLLSVVGSRPTVMGLLGLGVALAAFGIAQDVTIGDVPHMQVYGFWKTQEGAAPFGPFINRNHFAGWMVMVLPFTLTLMVERIGRTVPLDRLSVRDLGRTLASGDASSALMFGAMGLVMALSVAMTESRSGLLALGAGAGLLALHIARTHRSSGAAKALAAVVVSLVLVGAVGAGLQTAIGRFFITNEKSATLNIASAGGRFEIWSGSARMVAASPLAGYGLGSYSTATIILQDGRRNAHWNAAHNDYLQLAVEGGLLVCLPALVAAFLLVRDTRRRFAEAPSYGSTYWNRVGAVVGLISIGVQSIFEFSLQMPGNAALFAVLIGIALHRSPNVRTADVG